MHKLAGICFLLFVFVAEPACGTEWSGRVVGVSDGDTVTVLSNGKMCKVRLAGIDCPEKSQDFGQKAKSFTAKQCFGKTVTVVEHGKDRYGRSIAELITESGGNINQELLKSGLAWHYRQFSKNPYLAEMEAKAKAARVELWQDDRAIAPWDYRKRAKEKMSKN